MPVEYLPDKNVLVDVGALGQSSVKTGFSWRASCYTKNMI